MKAIAFIVLLVAAIGALLWVFVVHPTRSWAQDDYTLDFKSWNEMRLVASGDQLGEKRHSEATVAGLFTQLDSDLSKSQISVRFVGDNDYYIRPSEKDQAEVRTFLTGLGFRTVYIDYLADGNIQKANF